jgi:hypothetical protein
MTFEEINAELRKQGWRIWHLGENTKNEWSCWLFHLGLDIETSGKPGITGFDRDCWRQGKGPTLFAAMGAAAAGLLSQQIKMEETDETLLDLEAMLA